VAEVADFGLRDFSFIHLDLELVHFQSFDDGLYVADVLIDVLAEYYDVVDIDETDLTDEAFQHTVH
jgi:hypothetical protein